MKKHIALGICVLIFLIIGGCSFIMPQSGENGYNHFWGNGDSFRGVFTYYKDGEESPVTEEVTVNFSKVKGYGEEARRCPRRGSPCWSGRCVRRSAGPWRWRRR